MSRANTVAALWAAVAVAAAGTCVAIVIGAAPQATEGVERAVLPAAQAPGSSAALPVSRRPG